MKDCTFGTDYESVKTAFDRQQTEHIAIEKFDQSINKCREAERSVDDRQIRLYQDELTILEKSYNELSLQSQMLLSDLQNLNKFMQSAQFELNWLGHLEEKELNRDWSDPNLNVSIVESYYEKLMSDLESREIQFTGVIDKGESLIVANHPASELIEEQLDALQTKWAWLLQLTLCLETHLRCSTASQQFCQDCSNAEEWMKIKESCLQDHFSQSDFKLDEGEIMLADMQLLRDELSQYEVQVQRLLNLAQDLTPMLARKEKLKHSQPAIAICNYQGKEVRN